MEGSFKDGNPDGIWTYWDKIDVTEFMVDFLENFQNTKKYIGTEVS